MHWSKGGVDVTPTGWQTLQHNLHISTVIDLTSAGEAEALCAGRTADSANMQGDSDIKIVKLPVKQNAFFMDELEKKYRTYRTKDPEVRHPLAPLLLHSSSLPLAHKQHQLTNVFRQ